MDGKRHFTGGRDCRGHHAGQGRRQGSEQNSSSREHEFYYFTLFIHLRIGPVTESSAVFGDITSEMWLCSLNTISVGQ